jgi:3-phosphoshikimate 1-carboxyvinyltransferase
VASTTLTVSSTRFLRGALRVPGDKSLSHRYLMLGAIAEGQTVVDGLAPGDDVLRTLACLSALGVRVTREAADRIRIDGRGWPGLAAPSAPLDAGNSGTTMRLLAGLVASRPFTVVLTGDDSLGRRPMGRVLEPLRLMGAVVDSRAGRAPLSIAGGPLRAIDFLSPAASAQVKSAIMFAALGAHGTTSVTEPLPSRDHTERAFPVFGLDHAVSGLRIAVPGGQTASAPAGPVAVAGDPSSAAVWAAAAAAQPGSEVRIEGVCLNPLRIAYLGALERLGARVAIEHEGVRHGEPVGAITVGHGSHGSAVLGAADVPSLIDELPVLAARAALGGQLEVSGAAELRVKESDRISSLVAGLRLLGVRADERPDGFIIDGRGPQPQGAIVDARGDHRLVMAFALAALGSRGPTTVLGADAVAVSYPGFARDLAQLSA